MLLDPIAQVFGTGMPHAACRMLCPPPRFGTAQGSTDTARRTLHTPRAMGNSAPRGGGRRSGHPRNLATSQGALLPLASGGPTVSAPPWMVPKVRAELGIVKDVDPTPQG